MANSACQLPQQVYDNAEVAIHDMHAAACASGITMNPNDCGGTLMSCPPGTTVGTTCGRVLSFTMRRMRPDTDTSLYM